MKITNIINEVITEVLAEQQVWYHGSDDYRDIENAGGFTPRTDSTRYITDPQKWKDSQEAMKNARAAGDEDKYFEIIDYVGKLHGNLNYKKPIFFSDNNGVANTYSQEKRAFDYQNSEPKTIQANINDNGKVLKIPAHGDRFRGIGVDIVKRALINDGVPEDKIENVFGMFVDDITASRGKLRTDGLAVIAQLLGYDIIDVIGVLDSYQGGTTKSTVRMVFDPSRIRIIS